MEIVVLGGGLSGSEAAFTIARMGGLAALYEMRPASATPAHKTDLLAELVCSNSLKSNEPGNAHGLLKAELRLLGSLVMEAADACAIPGGKALVVDRVRFSRKVTSAILGESRIRVGREEKKELPAEGIVIVATGPLTSPDLAEKLAALTGGANLHFFDAISPIVEGESIDTSAAFFASRYGAGAVGGDYLNCPLTREEYDAFYDALCGAGRVESREFEGTPYFEGCLPIEIMAERGRQTLLFGPMKPVGLRDARTGAVPYAVLQLRREDAAGTMYNMVGFQTKLTYPEQERVFRLIPALRRAQFFRHGSIHRNTFINAPAVLSGLRLKSDGRIFFAGQVTGVEGYVESTAMGLLAGIAALCLATGREFEPPPPTTCIGALYRYIGTERKDFQPMNVNFGLLEGYDKRRKGRVAQDALAAVSEWRGRMEKALL